MEISYQGIGEWCATFAYGAVSEGQVVKLTASGTAGKCDEGDDFCGVVRATGRDGKACSVQLGGFAEVKYSGTSVPAVGYCTLAADGAGGVAIPEEGGRSHLVAAVDTAAGTAVILL